MIDLHVERTACHVVVVHPEHAYGALVRPHPDTDVQDPSGGPSLHAADWSKAIQACLRYGVEPDMSEDGDLLLEEGTGDAEVVVLVGDAVDPDWDAASFSAARREVLAVALGAAS